MFVFVNVLRHYTANRGSKGGGGRGAPNNPCMVKDLLCLAFHFVRTWEPSFQVSQTC
jgi:hypothetical protein